MQSRVRQDMYIRVSPAFCNSSSHFLFRFRLILSLAGVTRGGLRGESAPGFLKRPSVVGKVVRGASASSITHADAGQQRSAQKLRPSHSSVDLVHKMPTHQRGLARPASSGDIRAGTKHTATKQRQGKTHCTVTRTQHTQQKQQRPVSASARRARLKLHKGPNAKLEARESKLNLWKASHQTFTLDLARVGYV